MKTVATNILSFLGVAALLIMLGMKLERDRIAALPKRTTFTIVERPFELPSKRVVERAMTVPQTDERKAEEVSAFVALKAERDSLARAALESKTVAWVDTVAYADSLGSFYLRLLHTVTYDGLKNQFIIIADYRDGKLTTVNRTDTAYLKPSYFEMLLEIILSPASWLIAGVVAVATLL